MMPTLTKWPRDAEGAPLHFVAQICCEDLPDALWNGHGPRKGWLLLFVETLKLEVMAEGKTVQVLHTKRLGSERQPPDKVPTVRHAMSDYIGYGEAQFRPGVPKLWRKWPVDIFVQEYTLSDSMPYAPGATAEDLYGPGATTLGMHETPFPLDRPLMWRGARYVIQGTLKDLNPDELARNFEGSLGLLGAPEFDHKGLEAEILRRAKESPEYEGGSFSSFGRYADLYNRIKAEVRVERQTGWVDRAYKIFDQEIAQYQAAKAELDQDHQAGRTDAMAKIGDVRLPMSGVLWNIERFEGYRKALEDLIAQYPGPNPEAALTKEIRDLGQSYLEWAKRIGAAAKSAMQKIDANDPETPITAEDWAELTSAFSEHSAEYWVKSDGTIRKSSHQFNFDRFVRMAVREDLLDLYTRDNAAPVAVPADLMDDLEDKARYVEPGLPHRMGGVPNPVQDGALNPRDQLLFQVASDVPIGWMWGDVGALYVTISDKDLRRGRFGSVEAWIEGH